MNTEILIVSGEGSISLHQIVGFEMYEVFFELRKEEEYIMMRYTDEKPEIRHG